MVTVSHRVSWWLGRTFPDRVPLVYVLGYPKSGTVWVTQLVGDCLGLPFPRLSLLPVGCAAVLHGHELVDAGCKRCVYVIRDGRDAMVSMYFQLLRQVEDGGPGRRPRVPARLRRVFPKLTDKADVRGNMAAFVESQMDRPIGCRWTWAEHVRSALDQERPGVAVVRYEGLVADTPAVLSGAIATLNGEAMDPRRVAAAVERWSFEAQSGRSRGQENTGSFLRKGRPGDWETYFTPEAARVFDRHAGEMLVRAGYEPDRSWVDRLASDPPSAAGRPT